VTSEQTPRKLRADAARNRARVLDVAYEAFAAEGLAVPIDEIARRAGVGAGTVYRHFPTKESLFQAIVANRIDQLVEHASALSDERDPGEALFAFLATLVAEGATDQGLVEALAGVGFDLADAAPDAEQRFMAVLGGLLDQAQQAGAVRTDIGLHDLKTLLVGYQAMQRYTSDPASTRRLLAIARDGLTPGPAQPSIENRTRPYLSNDQDVAPPGS
jgi:AcrR family transcriptional regulator